MLNSFVMRRPILVKVWMLIFVLPNPVPFFFGIVESVHRLLRAVHIRREENANKGVVSCCGNFFFDKKRHSHDCDHLDACIETPALNGEREGDSPGRDLLAEFVDASNLAASNLGLEVLELVCLLGQGALDLFADLDGLVDVGGNALKVLLTEAARGHGGCADADAAGGEGGLVSGDGVLVAGNIDLLKDGLDPGAIEVVLAEVDKDHVRVGAIGNELVSEGLELGL